MSGRKSKEFWRSKRSTSKGNRPTGTQAGDRSTPDLPRESTVDPKFDVQPIPDKRASVPSPSDPLRILDPYPGGLRIIERSSSGNGALRPLSSGQPAVDSRFGVQPIPDLRSSSPSTSNQQRMADPYLGGLRVLERTSTAQRAHISRSSRIPTADPHFGVQPTPGPRGGDPSAPKSQPIPDPFPSGQWVLERTSGGQRAPVLISSRQHTLVAPFGVESTPDLLPIRPSTLQPQCIPDPYPGGWRVPNPQPSGQPINNGIYIITNDYHRRFVYLDDPNDTTPLRGHFRPGSRNAQWAIRHRENGQYSIENVEHSRYADSGDRAAVKAHVEGSNEERLWRIQALPTGEYTIATTDTRNFWMLPSDIADTPVELFNVYTDRRCWWTFKMLEIPVNEHVTAPPALIETKLLLAPPGGQSIPGGAIVGLTSVITKATNLLPPLGTIRAALRVVLQNSENIGPINEDRQVLIKRLKFHLATVENDIAKLEEDQKIDQIIPALNQDVKETLETYARELQQIYKLLFDNQSESSSLVRKITNVDDNRGIMAEKAREIDESFQRYTTALHQFAANTITQMHQLAEFHQEFKQGVEKAHSAAGRPSRNRANAYGIQHRECLQGTRETTRRAIGDWLDDANTTKWIFFFLDIAGSGKSTVAKHMAEKWKREKRLLARFFFSRDTMATMSTELFCSTVANAFSALDPQFKEHKDKATKCPDLGLLSFEELFEGLVAGPLRAIDRRAILIIDALDECDTQQRDELLETLRNHHSSIPLLRILVTGRPERDIKRWAEKKFGFGYMNFARFEENEKDVELYIKHRLRDIPIIQDRLYPVILHAEGLFIWARIACDLLLDSDDIEGLLEELGKEVSLDYLYRVALEQSMPKEGASRRAMVFVLQMILAAREPLSIAELEILSPRHGVVEKVVTRLSSVLLYQDRENPIRLLHATFREYLTTRSRADNLFIQPELGHHTLASGCLTTISNQSKQDNFILRQLDAISQRKEISLEPDNY